MYQKRVHEHAALRARDQLLDASPVPPPSPRILPPTAPHRAVARRPASAPSSDRTASFFTTPFSIHTRRGVGSPSPLNGAPGVSGSIGSDDERHALVHHLHADLVAAARLREEAASFVGAARVERAGDELHEIRRGRRLEHHRVATRLDRDRIRGATRLVGRAARRAPPRRSAKSFARAGPAAARAVRRAHRRRERGGRLRGGTRTVPCCSRPRSRRAFISRNPVDIELAAFADRGDRVARRSARSAGSSAAVASLQPPRSAYCLRAELRHRLRIFRRELAPALRRAAPRPLSDASSRELVVELAERLPNTLRTVIVVS